MLFQKEKVKVLAHHTGRLAAFPAEHLLLSVQGSRGALHMGWHDTGQAEPDDGLGYRSILYLGETPLIQILGSGCPTCESLLAAGYGLPGDCNALQAVRAALGQPYAGLADAVARVRPILGLLQPGIYTLSYSGYYPTDGDGRFYWDIPEAPTPYKATAEYYNTENYRVLPCFPCFLYPAQGAGTYDPRRVAHYRRRLQAGEDIPPVLAYSLWGYMGVLLDGHHRACACALEGKTVPALTISRPGRIWHEQIPYLLWPDGEEVPASALTPAQQALLAHPAGKKHPGSPPPMEPCIHFRRAWEPAYRKAARQYPTCTDVGALALYPGIGLDADGLRLLAMDDDYEAPGLAAQLLRYAARQLGADAKGLAMAFIAPGYPAVLRQSAFAVLDQIKGDPEIDDLMISVLVNCERKDDPIYRIADRHWE